MHGRGKSDGPVVPANLPNKAAAAEAGEERGPAKGNTDSKPRPGRSAGSGVSRALGRVREVARRDKDARFTALLHHVSLERLVVAYWALSPKAAPGVDAVSIGEFEQQWRDNLYKLWNRMSSGSYFPGPVRGVEIPKDHGDGVRLLGVPNTADRVAQTAAAMVLERILEPVFHRDSYGYRRGRSAHDALTVCRQRCWKKDWVLDIDVRAFFDSVPHSLLLKAVAHHTSER